MAYQEPFLRGCKAAGIPTRVLDAARALQLEPALHPGLKGAVQVPDASMDAWRLPLHFFAAARAKGAAILPFCQVETLRQHNRQITGVQVRNLRSGKRQTLSADIIVNAAGPWAGKVAALAGLDVPVRPGPGVMVSLADRYCNMVINRLHPAGEGDILVPQREQTIIGTTAWIAADPDEVQLPQGAVGKLVSLGARLMPALAKAPVHAVWQASRPLLCSSDTDDPMRISRGFTCIDHQAQDGIEGIISMVGGKATTLRAMAAEAADLICRKTGRNITGTTAATPLRPYRDILQTAETWI